MNPFDTLTEEIQYLSVNQQMFYKSRFEDDEDMLVAMRDLLWTFEIDSKMTKIQR